MKPWKYRKTSLYVIVESRLKFGVTGRNNSDDWTSPTAERFTW